MELFKKYRGKLELIGKRGDEVIYHDEGENTVTIWAKQATMHLLSGESFTSHGVQRLFDTDSGTAHTAVSAGEGTNEDGTLISGEQFFSSNTSPNFDIDSRWSKSTIAPSTVLGDLSDAASTVKFPFFPTKMLFGTGYEFTNWADVELNVAYEQVYLSEGWTESIFNNGQIAVASNDYSNDYSGTIIVQKRTMNDIYSTAISSPAINDNNFGITGAIKNGTYTDSSTERNVKTYLDGSQEFLVKGQQGVGAPTFIYAKRDFRNFQTGSEIQISADSEIENKITYSVVLPEQTGSNAGIYYPYNGYVIKEAGLFCDARFVMFNTDPSVSAGNIDQVDELNNYNKMPHGIMFAKRYVAPFTKTYDVSLTARWTLYL